jgi:hypothetical protein
MSVIRLDEMEILEKKTEVKRHDIMILWFLTDEPWVQCIPVRIKPKQTRSN